jgi:WD40 repeat protein
VSAVPVTPESRLAVSGSEDRKPRLSNVETGQTIRTLHHYTGAVTAVAMTRYGRSAIFAEHRQTRVWDLSTDQTMRMLEGHTESASAVAVILDARRAMDRAVPIEEVFGCSSVTSGKPFICSGG